MPVDPTGFTECLRFNVEGQSRFTKNTEVLLRSAHHVCPKVNS